MAASSSRQQASSLAWELPGSTEAEAEVTALGAIKGKSLSFQPIT